jgi:hypothetical protein
LRVSRVVVHISWEGTTLTLDDEHVVRRDDEKLGEQGGDFTPFVVDLDGEPHVLVAGESLDRRTRYVYVNERPTPVNPEAVGRPWMAPPLRFSSGMTVIAVGKETLEGDELWRIESPPVTDRPEPVFGPGWTRYSPLTD